MIDQERLQNDVLQLVNRRDVDGMSTVDVDAILSRREMYARYTDDHLYKQIKATLHELYRLGLIVLKEGGRYFPLPSILQDTPARPEEYLPPEVIERARQK
jgi:hypothetical protein